MFSLRPDLFCFNADFSASKPLREVVIFCLMMAATNPLARTSNQVSGGVPGGGLFYKGVLLLMASEVKTSFY